MSNGKIVRIGIIFNYKIEIDKKVIKIYHKRKLTALLTMEILEELNNPNRVHEIWKYELEFKPYQDVNRHNKRSCKL